MAVLDIHIAPIGTGTTSMHEVVARCVRVARDSALRVSVTPMGTVMEGAAERLLQVAGQMHAEALSSGVGRVITSIRLDERAAGEVGLEERIREVEEIL